MLCVRKTNQERFESMEKLHRRLIHLTEICNYTETNCEIKSQLIAGSIKDIITRKGPNEPDPSLDKLLHILPKH